MLRPPSSSTLFPYTTLFRSDREPIAGDNRLARRRCPHRIARYPRVAPAARVLQGSRGFGVVPDNRRERSPVCVRLQARRLLAQPVRAAALAPLVEAVPDLDRRYVLAAGGECPRAATCRR